MPSLAFRTIWIHLQVRPKKSQNALSVEYTQLPASPDHKRPIQGALLPDLGRKLGSTAMASGIRTVTVSPFP